MGKQARVLFLTNIISPYMHDLFNNLANYQDEIDFQVYACADKEPDREWSMDFLEKAKYKFKIMRDVLLFKAPGKNRFVYFGGLSLIWELFNSKYDVIVFKGGTRFVGPICAVLAKLLGVKTILWEENSIETTNTRLKKLIKGLYINKNLFSSFIAYGTPVKQLIEKLNDNVQDKIYFSLSPIDNDKYRSRFLKLSSKKSLIKKYLNIPPEKQIILFVGRFVDEKNIFTLLKSIKNLVLSGKKDILCLIAGGGMLEKELKDYVKDNKLNSYVNIIPFLQFNKLTMLYSIADLFVLPSRWEPWGLVVNEAMNFNLPVIVADKVGCANDLVKHNVNGYIFPYDNSDKLAEYLYRALDNAEYMGKNSYNVIKKISFNQVCETIIQSAIIKPEIIQTGIYDEVVN